MNSMHKLSDTRVRPDALERQARQRKIDAWLHVAASPGEQIAVALQTATDQLQGEGIVDLQRATALAQRLAKNSRAMHDTLGTLFDRGKKSEEHGMKRTEDGTMDEQVNALAKDMAGVKLDVADLKVDVAGIKVDVGGMKTDVAGLKVCGGEAGALACVRGGAGFQSLNGGKTPCAARFWRFFYLHCCAGGLHMWWV